MTRLPHILLCVLYAAPLLYAPGAASGSERFPPPQFESGHELPLTTVPSPRSSTYEFLDMAVLLGALSLASWLALKKRSRRGIFYLTIFSLVYFGFWREGCVCPIGAIQNVTLALFDSTYAVPVTVIFFFALPLVFTLFFGRTFCAAVCPLGAIQDLVLIHPLQLPRWLEYPLGLLGYVYLGAAVLFAATGSAFIICQYDPFVSFFRLSGSLEILILGVCFLLIGLFIGRPYCRFFCPYGAILRILSKFSRWRVTTTPDECIQCRLCENACPFGAIQTPYTAPPPSSYRAGRIKLLVLTFLFPFVIIAFGWAGTRLAPTFSRMNSRVRLAERIHLEETGRIEDTIDESDAFRATGQPIEELYDEAIQIGSRFTWGSMLFGVFVGLVAMFKLIALITRRTRNDFEPDRGRCVSCGRCFDYCPREHARRKQSRMAGMARPTG